MKLNRDDYRRRVLGCWLGKNIGGTLGAPFEFWRQVNDVSFYTQDLAGEPLPNDDLDLQLLWLIALEERGIDLTAQTLGEYWCMHITPHWSEYGIAKANLRAGLPPPLSGTTGNLWRHSCGAFIRSEIWACIAPGLPDVAARYAVEDAIVDHGDGEGAWGEVFFAAAESAAFVCDDIEALIDIGLSHIPDNCGIARAVRCALDAHRSGMDWRDARDAILADHRGSSLFNVPERTSEADREKGFDTGQLGYDAPSNVALAVLALLIGGDDFGRVVTTAVNCGEDTDCTGATAGAMFGLIHGVNAIPPKWIEPIGRTIKTISLNLGDLGHFGSLVPGNIDELTDRTERMAVKVLDRDPRKRMRLVGEETTDLSDGRLDALWADDVLVSDLVARVSATRHVFDFFTIDVEPAGGAPVRTGEPKAVTLTIRNHYRMQANLALRWTLPDGWRVDPAPLVNILSLPPIMQRQTSATFTLHPGELRSAVIRCTVELTAAGRPTVMLVPVVFLNDNLNASPSATGASAEPAD